MPRPRPEYAAVVRAFRDDDWLKLSKSGLPVREIARKFDVSATYVYRRLRVARAEAERVVDAPPPPPRPPAWLELVPLFPITPFTPGSKCPHHGPVRDGSLLCCMVCSQSGVDGHPHLRRDPASDPAPERRVASEPEAGLAGGAGGTKRPSKSPPPRETRRERRKREAAEREASGKGVGHAA